MLYKKYVIEVIIEQEFDTNSTITSNNTYDNHIHMNLVSVKEFFNIIRYIDQHGVMGDYPEVFNTYSEAYNKLSTVYYDFIYAPGVKCVKIVEILNDRTPPLEVLRSLKIQKLLK